MTFQFPLAFAVFLATPAPVLLRMRVHPLLSFISSSEFATRCLLLARKRSSTSPGVSFSFATSVQQVHSTMGFHTHLRSALSVLHALDGLLLLAPWRLVSSSCHVRDSLFRGFPRQSAGLTFISPSPHAVSDVLLRPSCPARAR
jgi:hypothetical protein